MLALSVDEMAAWPVSRRPQAAQASLVEGHAGRVDEAVRADVVAPAHPGEGRAAGPSGQATTQPVEPPLRSADCGEAGGGHQPPLPEAPVAWPPTMCE